MEVLELLHKLRMAGVKRAQISPDAKVCGEVEFYPVSDEELNRKTMSELSAAEIAWMETLKEEERQKYAEKKREQLFYYSS